MISYRNEKDCCIFFCFKDNSHRHIDTDTPHSLEFSRKFVKSKTWVEWIFFKNTEFSKRFFCYIFWKFLKLGNKLFVKDDIIYLHTELLMYWVMKKFFNSFYLF